MKKYFPPILCALLCGILLLSCVHLAFGAEAETESVYCFRAGQEGMRSPFSLELDQGENAGIPCFPALYCLDDPERRDSSVSACLLRPGVSPAAGTAYCRRDLEDAAGMDPDLAERLRAVVRSSYPARDIHSIQIGANAWLRETARPELRELTAEEALLAAQAAVWTLTAGNVRDPYTRQEQALETPHTAQNVQGLYDYLLALPGEAARYDTVSDGSLTGICGTYHEEADGTRTLTVSVTVDTTVSKQDFLNITASCGGWDQSQLVTGAGEYRFTFRGAEALEEAELELSGWQYGSDVYIFEAEDGAGPALLSHHSGMYPVYTRQRVPIVPEEPPESAEAAEE